MIAPGQETELRIGQVAKAAGVHVETVRFYERQRLIEQPAKPLGTLRRYSPVTVTRIRFIKHAQTLGFTLDEIRELLALRSDSPESCKMAKHYAQHKLSTVQDKIVALQAIEKVLGNLIQACDRGDPQRHVCPILQVME